jgi:hypothetical protein
MSYPLIIMIIDGFASYLKYLLIVMSMFLSLVVAMANKMIPLVFIWLYVYVLLCISENPWTHFVF